MTAASPSARSGGRRVALATCAVFVVMGIVALFPLDLQRSLLAEGGPFETLSVIGYGICIGLMLFLWPPAQVLRRWYFVVMLALFAGRELDLDKAPFTEGLLKARQYTGDTVPLPELILSAAILLAIIATVIILLRRETGVFLSGLRRGSPAAVSVLIGVLFIGVYKAIDGLGRKLEPFGIRISDRFNDNIAVIEEIGELGIPVMFGLAIWLAPPLLTAAARPHTGTGI